MNRRSTDELARRIEDWERTREALGHDTTHGLVRYINDEIDKLRFEKMVRERPMPEGRRAGDARHPGATPASRPRPA